MMHIAAMNIHLPVFFMDMGFYFGCGDVWVFDKFIFKFLRKCHTVFQWYTILHSQQQLKGVPISLRLHHHLLMTIFIIGILVHIK